MSASVDRELLIVALKRVIEATFSKSEWQELGLLTGSVEALADHERLYRSLYFGDDDYGSCILDVLPAVLGPDLQHLTTVVEFVGLEDWLRTNDPKMRDQLFGATVELQPEDLSALTDPAAIEAHLRRLRGAIQADPEHAIGVAKELVESTAKVVLHELGVAFDPKADLPSLVKDAQKALALHPGALSPTTKGYEAVRRVLSGLTSIAIGVDELRNLYGTGHGKAAVVTGLKPRHAQLAVDAASTYCRSLLATLADRTASGS